MAHLQVLLAAGFLLSVLLLVPGVAVASILALVLAVQGRSHLFAGMPWVDPTAAGLLTFGCFSWVYAAKARLSWDGLKGPLMVAALVLFLGVVELPSTIVLNALGDVVALTSADDDDLLARLMAALPPLCAVPLLFAAALIAFGPLITAAMCLHEQRVTSRYVSRIRRGLD